MRVNYDMADAKLRLAGFIAVNQFLTTSDRLGVRSGWIPKTC